MIARDAREVRQLVVDAPSVGESALSPAHWQFLAQAGFALDESSSVDDLEATVLGLVVPRLADLCVVRLRGDLATELEATASSVYPRPELLPFLRRSNRGQREVLSSRQLARRVGIGLERRAQQELVRRAFREQVTLVV